MRPGINLSDCFAEIPHNLQGNLVHVYLCTVDSASFFIIEGQYCGGSQGRGRRRPGRLGGGGLYRERE